MSNHSAHLNHLNSAQQPLFDSAAPTNLLTQIKQEYSAANTASMANTSMTRYNEINHQDNESNSIYSAAIIKRSRSLANYAHPTTHSQNFDLQIFNQYDHIDRHNLAIKSDSSREKILKSTLFNSHPIVNLNEYQSPYNIEFTLVRIFNIFNAYKSIIDKPKLSQVSQKINGEFPNSKELLPLFDFNDGFRVTKLGMIKIQWNDFQNTDVLNASAGSNQKNDDVISLEGSETFDSSKFNEMDSELQKPKIQEISESLPQPSGDQDSMNQKFQPAAKQPTSTTKSKPLATSSQIVSEPKIIHTVLGKYLTLIMDYKKSQGFTEMLEQKLFKNDKKGSKNMNFDMFSGSGSGNQNQNFNATSANSNFENNSAFGPGSNQNESNGFNLFQMGEIMGQMQNNKMKNAGNHHVGANGANGSSLSSPKKSGPEAENSTIEDTFCHLTINRYNTFNEIMSHKSSNLKFFETFKRLKHLHVRLELLNGYHPEDNKFYFLENEFYWGGS